VDVVDDTAEAWPDDGAESVDEDEDDDDVASIVGADMTALVGTLPDATNTSLLVSHTSTIPPGFSEVVVDDDEDV